MIRPALLHELEKLADIWLQASLKAHSFVSAEYWQAMQKSVSEHYLPNSETFVFEDKHQIKGFISILDDKRIGALFVAPQYQGQKIGHKLLEFAKKRFSALCLNVFVRNEKALRFYQTNDFKIIGEQIEPSTKEKELTMAWALGCKSGHHKRFIGDS